MTHLRHGQPKIAVMHKVLLIGSIKVTTEDSRLPDLFPLLKTLDPDLAAFDFDPDLLRVPQGTPIALITNVHPKDVKSVLMAYVTWAAGRKRSSASYASSTTRRDRRPC